MSERTLQQAYEELRHADKIEGLKTLIELGQGIVGPEFHYDGREYTILAFMIAQGIGRLSGGAVDTAVGLVKNGPLDAGSVASKEGRGILYELDLAYPILVNGEDGWCGGAWFLKRIAEAACWIPSGDYFPTWAEITQTDFSEAMDAIGEVLNGCWGKEASTSRWAKACLIFAYEMHELSKQDERIRVWAE